MLISGITAAASRQADRERQFRSRAGNTRYIGAMLALMLYPMKAAEIAIYALAFGDSAASMASASVFGRDRLFHEFRRARHLKELFSLFYYCFYSNSSLISSLT